MKNFEERILKLSSLIISNQKKFNSNSVTKMTVFFKKWFTLEKN